MRSLLMAAGALLFYGSLAWIANREHGTDAATQAFGAQAAVSAINTFVATMIMERLSRLSRRKWTAFTLAAGGATLWAAAMTLVVHWGAHTPNFAATVLPPILMGAFYCASYSAALLRFVHVERS